MVDGRTPTLLLPEPDDPTVAAFIAQRTDTHSYKLRTDKVGLSRAAELLNQGEVDAVIVGATYPSKEVFLTAIKSIGAPNKDASSFFVMKKTNQPTLYLADCAVNPEPGAELLARIAEQTAKNVQRLGEEPVVAFLSYSTSGSAGGASVEKVQAAVATFRDKHPEIITYGDIQWDAATDEAIFKKKNNGAGYQAGKRPNVLIFPNLDAGNIAYKVLERQGGYTAIGPLTQGLVNDANFHDLSRGVTPEALETICATVAKLAQATRA